jgi:coiled-coil and C2 domain-containing protein 2A
LDDRTTLAAAIELWSTTDQMLEIGAGDEAEHAILLCNYLLSMGITAWVVLGRGIPEGKAAYVLAEPDKRQELADAAQQPPISVFERFFGSAEAQQSASQRRHLVLFNPLTGQSYKPGDAHCPLSTVSCIFNQENVRNHPHAHHYNMYILTLLSILIISRFGPISSHIRIRRASISTFRIVDSGMGCFR